MSHKVLLIDDSDIDRTVYRSMLEKHTPGLVVEEAGNATEGIRWLRAKRYDCVFLDQEMPGGTGVSLLEAVQSFNKSPIVMLTAASDIDVAVAALRAGAIDYLMKDNLEASQLTAALQAAVMHHLQLRSREERLRRLALLQALLLQSEELILVIELPSCRLIEAGTVGLARIGVRRTDVIDKDARTLDLWGPAGFDAFVDAVLKAPAPLPTAAGGSVLQARGQKLIVEGMPYLVILARTPT